MALTPVPSEFRVTTLSVDTRFAEQIYGSTADFMIRMPATMRNVGRVALTSVEIPQVTYVFSNINTNFSVTDVGGILLKKLVIPVGNYTGLELAAAITTALGTVTELSGSGSCVYNSISNRFAFVNAFGSGYKVLLQSSHPDVAARTRDWGLGFNLGFRTHTVSVPAGGSTTSTASPSLAAPAYMLLQLQCPDMLENTLHRLADGSFVPAFAKLVLYPGFLNSGFYQIQYDDGGNDLRKENIFVRPSAISQLRFRLLDSYGNLVDMGDTDWSATLEFTEVVGTGQYLALNRAMPAPVAGGPGGLTTPRLG